MVIVAVMLMLHASLFGELVGKWTFNDDAGVVVKDSSGKGNNGTFISGGVTPLYTASPGTSAVSLTGVTQVDLGNSPRFNIGTPFSLEVWVWVDSVTGEALIFGKDTGIYGLSYYTNGKVYFYGGQTGNNNISGDITPGRWTHVVGTSAGMSGTDNMFLYIDGVLVSSRQSLGDPMVDGDALATHLGSGVKTANVTGDFEGYLDEARIYDYVLSPADIALHYAQGPNGTTVGTPIGKWSFNEGIGTVAFDSTTYSNSGTVRTDPNNLPTHIAAPEGGRAAISFDGFNDYMVVGNAPEFSVSQALSIEAWVYYESSTGEPMIIGRHTDIYGISAYNGNIYFYGGGSGGNYLSHTPPANTWFHVIGTVDNSITGGDNMFLYINGTQVASRVSTALPVGSSLDMVAGSNYTKTEFFKGRIDEARFYNFALSAAQAAAHFSAGPDAVNANNPSARWSFNENAGVTAYDGTVAGNDGVISGSTDAGNVPVYVNSLGKKAISIDGSKPQYINFGKSQSVAITGSYSIETWIKVNSANGYPMILGKNYDAYGMEAGGNSRLYFYGGATGNNVVGQDYVKGNWMHVVGVSDLSALSENLKIYVNGVLANSATTDTEFGLPTPNENVNLFSGKDYGNTADMTAVIDELRLYDHALTAQDVAASYAAGPDKGPATSCADILAMGLKLAGDVNSDCTVDMSDLLVFKDAWLECNDPQDAGCVANYPY
jgi:hypothetical protein